MKLWMSHVSQNFSIRLIIFIINVDITAIPNLVGRLIFQDSYVFQIRIMFKKGIRVNRHFMHLEPFDNYATSN